MKEQSEAINNIAKETISVSMTVAKLLGIVNPVAASASLIAEHVHQRRTQKFINRLERLVESLDSRIGRLEDQALLETNIDLLDEIIAQAISDEDEDKLDYYAALIEYYASHPISPEELRLLSSAFKSLLLSEIKEFANFAIRIGLLKYVTLNHMPIFWNRVHFLGLNEIGSTGQKNPSQVTQLGKHFVEVVKLVGEV